MEHIFRVEDDDKRVYLFELYNKGASNMRLAYNYNTMSGFNSWSKWIRYDYLMSLREYDVVKPLNVTKKEFMNLCTHRTMHPCELVYDFDDSNGYPSIKVKAKMALLKIKNPKKVYHTGHKSYHIHVYNPKMIFMNTSSRSNYREKLLYEAGADIAKKSDNSMIAIPWEKHYRSGLLKREVLL